MYQLGGLEVNTGRAWVEEKIRLSALCLSLGSGQWGVWFLGGVIFRI